MVGELIAGRFELEEIVGSGGMASVYRAHDRLLERPVALKILHDHYVHDEESVERFQREARSAAQLGHPNIVTVIDRGEDNGRPYIVFEYVGGENLKQLVAREGALPVGTAIDLGIQIAQALEAAHGRGVVHRDVKPQNVLLAGEGRAKVTDFGIARARGTEGLTLTGTIMGTSDYIAPEQAKGEAAGPASDIYSLGVVLYELLTGRVPYEAESPVAAAMRHVHDPVPSVRAVRPEVPPRLDACVRRALAKEPHDRFASMSDLIAELDACRRGDTPAAGDSAATMIVPPPARRKPRRGRRALRVLVVSLVAIALVVAAAIGAYVLTKGASNATGIGDGGAAPAKPVELTGVTAYDPDGTGPPGEHNADAPKATDGNEATYWQTESYRDGLNKPGVGVVLDAGSARKVHTMTVTTDTPGFTAEIEAGESSAGPFAPVSGSKTVSDTTTFTLDGGSHRYYVVWITNLGSNSAVHVNEVKAHS
ncbi:MAG TPA: protein kinase [Gaiellaceae bacterium]|nr:protein kinase [Gaiellaceae bacterium]